MMKPEVEFKHSKKMKKRRQLDALVDNIKLPRGRKNSASSHELLDQHSDSSDAEDYSVSSGPSKKKFCFCEGILSRISLLMVSIACISICIGLIWVQWHVCHELSLLREQMTAVQKSDASTPETITNLQKNLDTHDNSISVLRTSSTEMKTKLEGIDKKIEGFESTKAALDQKLEEAKEILDLPTKLTVLEKTVADMGSNVGEATTEISVLKKQINELKDKLAVSVPTPSENEREESNGDEQFTSMVVEKINAINQTWTQDLSALKQKVENQEIVITAFTAAHSTDSDVTSIKLNKLISDTVVKIMQNNSASSERQRINQTELDAVINDVNELLVMKSDFALFNAEMLNDLQYVNSTLRNFSEEFGEIKTHLTLIDKIVTNQNSLISRDSSKEEVVPEPIVTTIQENTVKNTSLSNNANSNSTEVHVKEGGSKAIDETPHETPDETEEHVIPTSTRSNDEQKRLLIEGIDSQAALHEIFKDNATMKISDFATALHLDNADLRKYDINDDGNVSEEEIAHAIRLKSEPLKRRKRSEW